jgi:hypothetical protein
MWFWSVEKTVPCAMGFGLEPAIQRGGSGFVFGFSQEEENSKKNFYYLILLVRGLAYPGAGY